MECSVMKYLGLWWNTCALMITCKWHTSCCSELCFCILRRSNQWLEWVKVWMEWVRVFSVFVNTEMWYFVILYDSCIWSSHQLMYCAIVIIEGMTGMDRVLKNMKTICAMECSDDEISSLQWLPVHTNRSYSKWYMYTAPHNAMTCRLVVKSRTLNIEFTDQSLKHPYRKQEGKCWNSPFWPLLLFSILLYVHF